VIRLHILRLFAGSLVADGPRLVVPGDISGGRYVSNVNRVFLEKSRL
jgi:hypothetical protein